MQVKIKVEFRDDGQADITLPGMKVKATDPAKLAELTEKIAKSLGPITERHAAHIHIKLDNGGEKIVYLEKNNNA